MIVKSVIFFLNLSSARLLCNNRVGKTFLQQQCHWINSFGMNIFLISLYCLSQLIRETKSKHTHFIWKMPVIVHIAHTKAVIVWILFLNSMFTIRGASRHNGWCQSFSIEKGLFKSRIKSISWNFSLFTRSMERIK